jgi:hypothetical protein
MVEESRIYAHRCERTGEAYVVIDVPLTVTPAEAIELADELRRVAAVALSLEAVAT